MKNSPLVSVIIPVYNAEKTLKESVACVLNQTFRDWELILVDDGSPDKSGEIADELAGTDSRIRVIHQKNGGVSVARNNGVAAARGEFIAFLDADDLWKPQFLEKMLKLAEKFPNRAYYFSGFEVEKPDGRIETIKSSKLQVGESVTSVGGYYDSIERIHGVFPHTDCVFIPRENFLKCGGFKPGMTMGEDHFCWMKLSLLGEVAFLNEVLTTWRSDIIDREKKPRAHGKFEEHFYYHLKDFYEDFESHPNFQNYFIATVLRHGLKKRGKGGGARSDDFGITSIHSQEEVARRRRFWRSLEISNWLCVPANYR